MTAPDRQVADHWRPALDLTAATGALSGLVRLGRTPILDHMLNGGRLRPGV